jgi:hypothetical protein
MTDTIDMFSGSGGLPAPRKPQQVLSFGKHKGQPFEVLLQDSGYALWLMNSMFGKLQTSHPELLAFLVSRYGVPDRTPVHNKLQNRFLDESFCLQFALAGSAKVRKSAELFSSQPIDVEAIWRKHVQASTREWPRFSGMEERAIERKFIEPTLNRARDALLHEAAHIKVCGVDRALVDGPLCPIVELSHLELEVEGADVRFLLERGYTV